MTVCKRPPDGSDSHLSTPSRQWSEHLEPRSPLLDEQKEFRQDESRRP